MGSILQTFTKPDYVDYDGAGNATITLSRKLMIGGVERTTLTMREPTVRDEKLAQKTGKEDGEKEVILMANLCGLLPVDIENLPSKDYRRLQEAYLGFLL